MDDRTLRVIRLDGLTDYREVWELQKEVHQAVVSGADDTLILTEHRPVITIGRAGGDDHLLSDESVIKAAGIEIVHTNRGGDITYHGPGQIVCYPIFDLHRHTLDVHRFLRELEEVGIRLLADYGVHGYRVAGRTGVWTDSGKVAAIGVHVKKWVTMHGIAINIRGELAGFRHIVPCGIEDGGVASVESQTGDVPAWKTLIDRVIRGFHTVFHFIDAPFNDISQSGLPQSSQDYNAKN